MDDQEDDEFDVGRVDEGKGNSGVVESMNHESGKNRSAYMREYRQRPEVIKRERLRLKLRTEMRRETTIHDLDEVSEAHLFRVNQHDFFCNSRRIWDTMVMMSPKLASKLAKRKDGRTSQKELQKRKHNNGRIILNTEIVLRSSPSVRHVRPKELKKRKQ